MSGMNDEFIIRFTDDNNSVKYIINELRQMLSREPITIKKGRDRTDVHTRYYLVEEQYNSELRNDMKVQHGRTYVCKRRWCE